MKNTDTIRRVHRWSIFALTALAMGLVAMQPTAASETQDEYWQRTGECLSLFFSNPQQHALECIGDNERGRPSTLAPGVPYSPPGAPFVDPCEKTPVRIENTAAGPGFSDCDIFQDAFAPLVGDLFGDADSTVVNI